MFTFSKTDVQFIGSPTKEVTVNCVFLQKVQQDSECECAHVTPYSSDANSLFVKGVSADRV